MLWQETKIQKQLRYTKKISFHIYKKCKKMFLYSVLCYFSLNIRLCDNKKKWKKKKKIIIGVEPAGSRFVDLKS